MCGRDAAVRSLQDSAVQAAGVQAAGVQAVGAQAARAQAGSVGTVWDESTRCSVGML